MNAPEHHVPESGFYALDDRGRELVRPLVRLVAVQHKWTTAHHYRIAKPDEHSPPVGRLVTFDLDVEGKAELTPP